MDAEVSTHSFLTMMIEEFVGGGVGHSPPEALGILGITDIYSNDNFEPTTPFLSDQKNLILSLNFVG
jgi:hypothetical protein